MTSKAQTQYIDALWSELRRSINAAHKAGVEGIRDYAENQTWHDATDSLLKRETVHEKGHRGFAPGGYRHPLSKPMAAKVIILSRAVEGAEETTMPPATIFLQWRDTAAEAYLLGYLIREHLSAEWRAKAAQLDYAKLAEAS